MKPRIILTMLVTALLSLTMLNSCTTKRGAIRQLQDLSYKR